MEWQEMYDILVDYGVVTQDALDLAVAIGGCNEETMERVLFYYTGWHSFEGWLGEAEEEEDE